MRTGRPLCSLRIIAAAALVPLLPRDAHAGMPSLTLTDLARMRVETMSFFLVVLLASALAVMLLWNWLRRDFGRLPRLTYFKSLGVVSLWGLLFILVLTMISGARELMTPGAWEKTGLTYRLAADGSHPEPSPEMIRREKLQALKLALWAHAESTGGTLPGRGGLSEIPQSVWQTPDPSRIEYIYVPGRSVGSGREVVAYEPAALGPDRFALLSDGSIAPMPAAELRAAATRSERP